MDFKQAEANWPTVSLASDKLPDPIIDVRSATVTIIGWSMDASTALTDKLWRIAVIVKTGTTTPYTQTTYYPNGDFLGYNYAWSERMDLEYSRGELIATIP